MFYHDVSGNDIDHMKMMNDYSAAGWGGWFILEVFCDDLGQNAHWGGVPESWENP